VDVARRTLLLDGVTRVHSLLDNEATTWWELPPGAQTVQLLAPNFDGSARVDVIYRAAYL
jgi:hypothetical protein